jgi:ubiquinone biosynthesis protein
MRLEAAAISEMAENTKADEGFRVPQVDWRRTQRRVLTLEWIDGIPISDVPALRAAGHDLGALGLTILQSFLRHAMRDGFFHADMHQGNLFVDQAGRIVAVDFGIMGRLGAKERRFLAEILHGLITRDYRRAAEVHFWAGYVPPHHPVEVFAQALRAIGEPIHGRKASEISMADLLGQLFAYTEVFDMQTRPELLLLQKTMVVAEGVARALDPSLNMWSAAEPIAKQWMEANLGPTGALKDAREGASELSKFLADVPSLLSAAERTMVALAEMARGGVRLDDQTVTRLAEAQASADRRGRLRWLLSFVLVLGLLGAAAVWWLLPHLTHSSTP